MCSSHFCWCMSGCTYRDVVALTLFSFLLRCIRILQVDRIFSWTFWSAFEYTTYFCTGDQDNDAKICLCGNSFYQGFLFYGGRAYWIYHVKTVWTKRSLCGLCKLFPRWPQPPLPIGFRLQLFHFFTAYRSWKRREALSLQSLQMSCYLFIHIMGTNCWLSPPRWFFSKNVISSVDVSVVYNRKVWDQPTKFCLICVYLIIGLFVMI